MKRIERLRARSRDLLDIPLEQIPNYREAMRDIVGELSKYARTRDPKFVVIGHGAFDLLFWSQREYDLEEAHRDPLVVPKPGTVRPVGMPMRRFIQAIDGFVMDGQFCSPLRVPQDDLKRARDEGLKPLSLEHCKNNDKAIGALQKAAAANIVTFAEGDDDLTFSHVPDRRPIPENPNNVLAMSNARNMLPLFSAKSFPTREAWLAALRDNNYDVLIVDAFDRQDRSLTKQEVHQLKFKQMGARRLVLARVDIGYADDSHFYFKDDWQVGSPSWLTALGADYPGQYIVEFWNPAWKSIIGKYFAGIVDLGFDGVMLDGLDAYRLWEAKTPITPAN
jgi:endo-alpha-1,4-polygalactosaminidase (GH114 family)